MYSTVVQRNLALEIVRVTEAAALAAGIWQGKGDKNAADQAAVDQMRKVLNTIKMDGTIVIREGEKDEVKLRTPPKHTHLCCPRSMASCRLLDQHSSSRYLLTHISRFDDVICSIRRRQCCTVARELEMAGDYFKLRTPYPLGHRQSIPGILTCCDIADLSHTHLLITAAHSSPSVDIAVDPLDGTTLTANGREGAIAVRLGKPATDLWAKQLPILCHGPFTSNHSVRQARTGLHW